MLRKSLYGISLTIAQLLLSSHCLSQSSEDLTRFLPEETNVLVMVNETELFDSKMAKANDWQSEKAKAFFEGQTMIPPGVEDYVLASSVDLEFGQRNWEIALIQKASLPSANEIAKLRDGQVDRVADREAVILPGDTYLVRLRENIAAGISPANRQTVSRWIKRFDSQSESRLSNYLQQAASYSNDNRTHMVLALDLTDALSPEVIQSLLRNAGTTNINKATQLMKTIQGVTLGINFGEVAQARILLDFKEDADPLKKVGKDLIINSLGEYGLMLDEISEWESITNGTRLELFGTLEESSVRRLAMMIQPASMNSQGFHTRGFTYASGSNPTQRSINYLKTVLRLHDEVMKYERQTVLLRSYWVERHTEAIDRLTVISVDPEMVEFSEELTTLYRAILDRIALEKANERYRSATNHYGYRRGRYYRYGYRNAGYHYRQPRDSIRDQEEAKAGYSVAMLFTRIEELVKEFRHEKSREYETDF